MCVCLYFPLVSCVVLFAVKLNGALPPVQLEASATHTYKCATLLQTHFVLTRVKSGQRMTYDQSEVCPTQSCIKDGLLPVTVHF